MNQSTVLIAGVLGMFVLYLAMNNRLGIYVAIIWPRAVGTQAGGTASGSSSGMGSFGQTPNPPGNLMQIPTPAAPGTT